MLGEDELEGNPGAFSDLASRASAILDFDGQFPPGLTVAWNSSITPRFQRTIRAMILPPHPMLGFTYSSSEATEPQFFDPEEEEGDREEEEDPMKPAEAPKGEEEKEEASPRSMECMLNGDLMFGGMVQGMAMFRFPPRVDSMIIALSSLEPDKSMFMSHVQYKGDRYTTKLGYNSQKHKFEAGLLAGVTNALAVGGSVSYAAAIDKPGFSIGCRYNFKELGKGKHEETQLTAAINNNLKSTCTYTTRVLPSCFMSTRYSIDLNNFHSDVAIGAEVMPNPNFPLLLKTKLCSRTGLAAALGVATPFFRVMLSGGYNPQFGVLAGLSVEV